MSIIETAKKLLKKGVALNDEELINLANSLIEGHEEVNSLPDPSNDTPTINVHLDKPTSSRQRNANVEQFTMAPVNAMEQKTKVPITVTKRKNTFVDDLTEHRDVETPDAPITERKRAPTEKMEQLCSTCSKTFHVLPVHARELYVCDECVANKTKGR